MKECVLKYITFLLLIFTCYVNAQKKDFHSQLSQAKLFVYEDPEKAVEILKDLEPQIVKSDSQQKVDFSLTLGGAYSSLKNHKEALKYAFDAYGLVKNSKSATEQLKVLGFIANQYYILQIDDKLNQYLDQSEEIISRETIPDSMNYLVANTYFIRALNYKDKLDCNFAINYFNRAIEFYKKENSRNSKINLPITYIQKGYCFLDQEKLDSADQNFRQAYQISSASQILYNQSYALIGIAKVLYHKGDYYSALDTLRRIENEESNISIQSDVYKAYLENYMKTGDFGRYEIFSNRYFNIRKQLEHYEINSINNLLDSQEKDAEKSFRKYKINQIFRYFTIIFGLFSVIFTILLLYKKYIFKRL